MAGTERTRESVVGESHVGSGVHDIRTLDFTLRKVRGPQTVCLGLAC